MSSTGTPPSSSGGTSGSCATGEPPRTVGPRGPPRAGTPPQPGGRTRGPTAPAPPPPPRPPPAAARSPRTAARPVPPRKRELEQVHICLGTRAYPQAHPARYVGYVLNTVLGGSMSSRLFQNVRGKRGLGYPIPSGVAAS